MQKILLTGATGNVGQAIREHFQPAEHQQLLLATRNADTKAANERYFDFEDPEGTAASLKDLAVLFILRPPQIANVNKYFKPLVDHAVRKGVQHIVFLSVQGAENISFIPHAKIEKLIKASGIPYTFIRPSYFMQNLTTTLLPDIRDKHRIFLPAGGSGFLWVDVSDIGKAIARVLREPSAHQNKAYTITGKDIKSFGEVAEMLSEALDTSITYESPNPLRFYFAKRKEGIKHGMILVMIMLHYLRRFQQDPQISGDFEQLTGEEPISLATFIQNHKSIWTFKQ